MKIQIDQSGKIEYTSVPTVVADSKGNYLFIKSNDKKYLQQIFRKAGKPQMFVIETFSLLVLLVIQKTFSRSADYVIDVEYPGKNEIIKSYIIRFSRKLKIAILPEQINFSLIGKKSKSHWFAIKRFRNELKGEIVELKSLLKILLDFFE